MHTKIQQILSVKEAGGLFITTIRDADGNIATGIGNDYSVGEPVVVYFHDRFNRCKFHRPKPSEQPLTEA